MITEENIENWFTYHTPDAKQQEAYVNIRSAAKVLARIILANTPVGADQSAAMRKLRECVMTANAAIACDGK